MEDKKRRNLNWKSKRDRKKRQYIIQRRCIYFKNVRYTEMIGPRNYLSIKMYDIHMYNNK